MITFGTDNAMEDVRAGFYFSTCFQQPADDSSSSLESRAKWCGIMALIQTCAYQQTMEPPEVCREKLYETTVVAPQ